MKLKIALCISLVLLLAPAATRADHCSVTATSMDFGEYDVFDTRPTSSRGSVTVQCNGPEQKMVSFEVSMTTGNSGTYSVRKMNGPGESLDYNIYRNAAGTEIWGNGTDRTTTVSGTSWKDLPTQFDFFGIIREEQDVAAGAYSDSITVDVYW